MNTSVLEQAVALHKAGNLEDAEQSYLDILVDDPENAEVLKLLGVLACQQGNPEDGISYLEAAVDADSNVSEYHLALGRAHFESGKFEEGIASAVKAGELDPGSAEVFATLGYFYQHVQGFAEAQRSYERASIIDPDNVKFQVGAGLSAYFASQHDVAREYLNKAVERDNTVSQAYYGLALLNADAGEVSDAQDMIGKALALDAENPEYQRLKTQLEDA